LGRIRASVYGAEGSDPVDWQQHIRPKRGREEMAKRFKKAADPLKLVIVRDMWLTGFDAPCMQTMYVDKPMSGHNLMHAIARVNRVFKNKPGGLIVDYLGLAAEPKKALAQYTQADQDDTGIPIDQAVEVLLEKYEIVQGILHGFDYSLFFTGTAAQRVSVIPEAMDFILQLDDGRQRFVQAVTELSKACALVATHDEAVKLREEIAFFQCLRAQFAKLSGTGDGGGSSTEDLDAAVRQIISKSIASDEVIDIFAAAGMDRPDISILSDEFLAEVRDMPHRNLALEVLRKLPQCSHNTRETRNSFQTRFHAFSSTHDESEWHFSLSRTPMPWPPNIWEEHSTACGCNPAEHFLSTIRCPSVGSDPEESRQSVFSVSQRTPVGDTLLRSQRDTCSPTPDFANPS